MVLGPRGTICVAVPEIYLPYLNGYLGQFKMITLNDWRIDVCSNQEQKDGVRRAVRVKKLKRGVEFRPRDHRCLGHFLFAPETFTASFSPTTGTKGDQNLPLKLASFIVVAICLLHVYLFNLFRPCRVFRT